MMSHNSAKALLEKYKIDDLSEEEKALVEKWLFKYQHEGADLSDEAIDAIQREVWAQLQVINKPIKTKLIWPRMVAAACLLFTLGTGLILYLSKDGSKQIQIAKTIGSDIIPGGNKAILTLASGKRISLTDAGQGELAKQPGIRISKTSDGQLVYQVSEDIAYVSGEINYNTVETPRGGQYQVNLPDGSRVWLNAATVLKFPLSFSGLNERKVELKGEAYFEVEKDVQKPFIVQSDGQLIKVLGTHFNVCSYDDEPNTKTTLLEGSVKVEVLNSSGNDSQVLVPGQQAQTSSKSNHIRVANVDVQAETSWKSGFFSFEDAPIEIIMKQIARWYDVDVIYKDNLAGKTVWGSITRYSDVSKILYILEKTGKIHFKIEGRRIIVSK
jgi:transmembrane sensor